MQQNIKIVVALGTNVNQNENMKQAVDLLRQAFADMRFGRMMWTEPIGLPHSDKFLNMLGVGYTKSSKQRVERALKSIEKRCGRSASASKLGVIAMDIDILLFGDEKCHEEDWERDYIQELMGEINH